MIYILGYCVIIKLKMEGGCFQYCTSSTRKSEKCNHLTPNIKRKCINGVHIKKNCLNPELMYLVEDKNQKKQFIQQKANERVIETEKQQLSKKQANQEQNLNIKSARFANFKEMDPQLRIKNNQEINHQLTITKFSYILNGKNRSSLYGGAKSILKNKIFVDNLSPSQISNGLLSTQLSFIKEEQFQSQQSRDLNGISNSVKPQQKNKYKITNLLTKGTLLGKGNYCHISLCKDSQTYKLFTLKQLFKTQFYDPKYKHLTTLLNSITKIYHPYIINCYSFFQEQQKITIVQQYTPTTLYQEIKYQEKIPLFQVIEYLRDIIEAVIFLHDMNLVHNNLNSTQIGLVFGVAKVRMSLTSPVTNTKALFLNDIHAIALLGYEMAFGFFNLNQQQIGSSKYQLRGQQYNQHVKIQMMKRLNQQIDDQTHKLKQFILELLSLKQNQKLSACLCLEHQLFKSSSY